MEKFQLSILIKIAGISSASGLVYDQDKLFLIADNSTFLYEYRIPTERLNKIALVENPQENIPKKDKPDFESITLKGNKIYVIGSGSTKTRNKIYSYKPESAKTKEKDWTATYTAIKKAVDLSDDEFNIEGTILNGETIYFFNRGNGGLSKNGIITNFDDAQNPIPKFIPFELPKIKNVSTTFTDAILVDDTIYFLATAEETTSTYEDGQILGSLIGTIDLKTMKLMSSTQISDKHKFEGLTLYKKTATQIELLLCEDNDTEEQVSNIYKLVIQL